MNEVNRTLYIPLCAKARVSRQGIILNDPMAERIWAAEAFPLRGRSASKWLAYNMAMRARVFDDWTEDQLRRNPDALVLHIGCGLDSRCMRVSQRCRCWIDADLPDVIAVRRRYYAQSETCRMVSLDASCPDQVMALPDGDAAIVVLEGLSMYLSYTQLRDFLKALREKYHRLHILMDVYTAFGAWASKVKNPVNDVGVTQLYGIDDLGACLDGLGIALVREHRFTPRALVDELKPLERLIFRGLFTGRLYRKIYRLVELAGKDRRSP